MARTGSPCSVRRNCSTLSGRTNRPVAHPPQTDDSDSSTRHPQGRQVHLLHLLQPPGGHQADPGSALHHRDGPPGHHQHQGHQYKPGIRDIIRKINNLTKEEFKKKKESENIDIKIKNKNKKNEEEEDPENVKEDENVKEEEETILKVHPKSSRDSYLREPGPGAEASLRRSDTAIRMTGDGVDSSSVSIISKCQG